MLYILTDELLFTFYFYFLHFTLWMLYHCYACVWLIPVLQIAYFCITWGWLLILVSLEVCLGVGALIFRVLRPISRINGWSFPFFQYFEQLTGNAKSSWNASPTGWASLSRAFRYKSLFSYQCIYLSSISCFLLMGVLVYSSKPTGNDVIVIDLGTTNSCVSVMEGKVILFFFLNGNWIN